MVGDSTAFADPFGFALRTHRRKFLRLPLRCKCAVPIALKLCDHMGTIDEIGPPVRKPIGWNHHFHVAMSSTMTPDHNDFFIAVTPMRREAIHLGSWREVLRATSDFVFT